MILAPSYLTAWSQNGGVLISFQKLTNQKLDILSGDSESHFKQDDAYYLTPEQNDAYTWRPEYWFYAGVHMPGENDARTERRNCYKITSPAQLRPEFCSYASIPWRLISGRIPPGNFIQEHFMHVWGTKWHAHICNIYFLLNYQHILL